MSGDERYDRQIGLFGHTGQERLRAARVVVVGLGGLGCHLAQQLAYLGVTRYALVDDDTADTTNLNRLVGATPDDVGAAKTAIAARAVLRVQPGAEISEIRRRVPDREVAAAVRDADAVVAGLDLETPRLVLTGLCTGERVPYVDCATEVIATDGPPVYGGEVVASTGDGCLSCLDLLDQGELARESMNNGQRAAHDAVYGVTRQAGSGPSVVTLNGVVASLAATELMCLLTGLRPPARHLRYRGDLGTVARPQAAPRPGCPYCARWHAAA